LEADTGEAVMRKVCLQAVIEEELGNFDTALAVYRHTVETSRVTQPGTVDDWPARWVSVLARQDTTAAAAVVDSIAASMTDTPVDEQHAYWGCRGWLELSKGNAQAACAWFERAVGAQDQMWYRYPLGLAYLEAGRADDAIRTFEGILTWYSISRLVEPSWAVKTYYHLGRSYETAGRTADAERLYLEFLDVWSTADPVFDEVTEARARLAQLASGM
jgi:tetratricopeptide (TPR) repeat protein